MLKESFEKVEKALVGEAKRFYGERLISIVLYGSAARGTQRFDSDLDCLLVCKDLPNGRIKRVKEFERIEDSFSICWTQRKLTPTWFVKRRRS
jgi:predicted nucleotidyltransferase